MASKKFRHLADIDAICILAFIGGFYDTAGFILLYGGLTSSLTGNLVQTCSTIFVFSKGAIFKATAVLTFFLSGFINGFISFRLKSVRMFNDRMNAVVLLSVELLFMIIACVVGFYYRNEIENTDQGIDDWHVILVGCIMTAAMGFHNVAAKETVPNCPATTVMTATLITVAQAFSKLFAFTLAKYGIINVSPRKFMTASAKQPLLEVDQPKVLSAREIDVQFLDSYNGFIRVAKPLFTFSLGSIVATIIALKGSFWFSIVPIAMVLILIIELFLKEYSVEKLSNLETSNVDNKV